MNVLRLPSHPGAAPAAPRRLLPLACAALVGAAACASSPPPPAPRPATLVREAGPPDPDPRVGLRGGLLDAEEAVWNMRLVSSTPPPPDFIGSWNSDLAFKDNYVIQGNFHGILVWDVTDPSRPQLVTAHVCPGDQNDVSVYGNLLFVSVESPTTGRLDCGTAPIPEVVSPDRVRGVRIFDISDIRSPKLVANVQTCRGSHTHTVLEHPGDRENVYIYVSGTAPSRPEAELAGCSSARPEKDSASVMSRIDVIRVPLANPEQAAVVSSPRILAGLLPPPRRATMAPADAAEIAEAKARGMFVVEVGLLGEEIVLPSEMTDQLLAQIVAGRGGSGAPTAADSAALREMLPALINSAVGGDDVLTSICHDITVYPAIGRATGACIGYGLLLDISDPVNPLRLDAVADSNFVAWHSATFSNDGTKVVFTDEWGGGTAPKCRATDPKEWGANAIFTIENDRLRFQSYFKIPAAQTPQENCVAHNGSLIPIPGRDVMVQGWYQGGVSVFDFTDPRNPIEIAFFDRGPVDSTTAVTAGSWSAYWHNGYIYSSEIARGLDILELVPSAYLSTNEIEAAKTVRFGDFNPQGQPRFEWPATFVLARAYLDQLERSNGLAADRIQAARVALDRAERASGRARREMLERLASELEAAAAGAADRRKTELVAEVVRELAANAR
jgi:hypothetical protein|nr:MAG: hypothetical protein DIU52_04295 [bacterium]